MNPARAALGAALIGALAGCSGPDPAPPREIPRLERPALDPRLVTIYDDPALVRVDDRYRTLVWRGGEPEPGGPRGRVWEFESGSEGWSFQNGARPDIRDGRIVYTRREGRQALLSSPDLNIRFRTIRAIEIKMSASAGKRLTLAWSPDEDFKDRFTVTADLRPGPEPRVYTVKASSLGGYAGLTLNRLRLAPTDADGAEVAIDWVRLVPREGIYAGLGHGLGREEIGNESRNVLYARAPASYAIDVALPRGAVLSVGAGIVDADPGMSFSVTVESGDGPVQTVLAREVIQDERWEDATAELGAWGGRTVRLVFSVTSARKGSVALWASPTIHSAAARSPKPNVLVYLVDTLRADHVGCYGARNATTPAIDALARAGVVFERCTAQASWTRPSIASLFTSLYPPDHGVIDHGYALSDGVLTMAEQFRRGGYLTAAFVTSTHAGSSTNLDQGYDQLYEPPAVTGSAELVVQGKKKDYSKKNSEAINRRFLPWLEQHKDRTWFAYLHAMDPHAPYLPPPPYDRMFATPYRGAIDGSYDPDTGFYAARSPEDLAHVLSLYDGDIRDNDDRLGEIVAALGRMGLLDNTIVVVTSDHGEEFREHGGLEHGHSLYEELLHIPLVVHWPRGLRAGRVAEPTESIDLYPSLCALASLPIPPDLKGVPRLGSRPGAAPAPAPRPTLSWRLGSRGEEISVRNARLKLIRRPAERDLLFDLEADPGETRNLARADPRTVEDLAARIEHWWSLRRRIVATSDSSAVTIDQEERQWLEALGYVK